MTDNQNDKGWLTIPEKEALEMVARGELHSFASEQAAITFTDAFAQKAPGLSILSEQK